MPYEIQMRGNEWILNSEGDVLVEDTDTKTMIWVPQNIITFDNKNNVCFHQAEQQADQDQYQPSTGTGGNNSGNEYEATPNDVPNDPNNNDSETENTIRNVWSYNDTLSLISAVESRYDDMHHVHKRKSFWSVISNDLSSENISFSEKACQKKWLNLVRTYKSTKDNKKKTGRGPTRFQFFDRLDELLGDSPTNCSPHSIDVSQLEMPQDSMELEKPSTSNTTETQEKKRKNPTMEYVKIKKRYYDRKEQEVVRREELQSKLTEKCLEMKQKKLELYEKKLEIEQRKVAALEKLANEKM